MATEFVRTAAGETVAVQIINGTRVQDRSVLPGEVLEVSWSDALDLFRCNKAVRYHAPAPVPEPTVVPATDRMMRPEAQSDYQTRDVQPEIKPAEPPKRRAKNDR